MAIKNICQEGKTILISCAAAETSSTRRQLRVQGPAEGQRRGAADLQDDEGQGHLQDRRDRQQRRLRHGRQGATEKLAADEYGITIAISEVYDKQATDLTGVLTKVKGQDVQAVVNWSIVPAQSLVAKNMKQIGLDVPLFQSHGLRQHQVRAGRRRGGQRHDLPVRPAAGRGRAAGNHPQKARPHEVQEGLREPVQGRRQHLRRPRLRRPADPDRGDQEGRQHRPREGPRRHREPQGRGRHGRRVQLLAARTTTA